MKTKTSLCITSILISIVSLCISCYIIGFQSGVTSHNTKTYEVACLEADFIRYIIDYYDNETESENFGKEIKDRYHQYFLDMDKFGVKHIKSAKEFNDYYWSY